MSSTLAALWPEVDRIALCVHRPAGSDPDFRELVQRLRIPAGSVVVVAARHLAAGRVTIEQLELLSRYESRSVARRNAERHVEFGFLEQLSDDEFAPSQSFQTAARAVVDLQARCAEMLWAQRSGELAELATLVGGVVDDVSRTVTIPVPAFRAQVADHATTPTSSAGQVLAYVTELRYLRSDLHAHALAAQGWAGPTARAVDRLWKGNELGDDDIRRLSSKGLAERDGDGWRLTDAARDARSDAEAETGRLTAAAFAAVPEEHIDALYRGLGQLSGEDPRPPDAR